MYSIGDMIVYGSSGVMRIVDIREELVINEKKKYYVLSTVGSNGDSLTFVPIDNERLTSMMRPLMTREEIMAVLHGAKELPEAQWVRDNRVRAERFKKIVDSGNVADMMAMIRSIYKTGLARAEEGKKNYLSDESVMHKAEKLINTEFSMVLGIPEEEVPHFIASEMEK